MDVIIENLCLTTDIGCGAEIHLIDMTGDMMSCHSDDPWAGEM